MAIAPTTAVEPVAFVPRRSVSLAAPRAPVPAAALATSLLRIRGTVGSGFYWSLRAAGASPQVAAQYLSALATATDVGDVAASDSFDLVLGEDRQLLYAGLMRTGGPALQLVRWPQRPGEWINAADASAQASQATGMALPASGPITSYFGYRYHPILHFTRFHAGIDIGAGWGSPILAAADGQVVSAGWSGGYGREVRIAHAGGLVSLYGHMSEVVALPGSFVRQGQLIGYVGSSGLSTGPHLHFEVRRGGEPVNPLAVHFRNVPLADPQLAAAVRERLKILLSIGVKRSQPRGV
jgi:murein DD-endopeptidase MepM/ murein hydrolase activator NlpD